MKAVLAVVATLALVLNTAVARADDRACGDPEDARHTRDAILTVEGQLRAAPVAALSGEQQVARARSLDELHRYAEAGIFPHNHESRTPVPIFEDEHGTLCAFANLLRFTGHGELVKRIVATCNHAKVAQLASEPEVQRWAEETGISLAEAARIQRPAYRYTPRPDGDEPRPTAGLVWRPEPWWPVTVTPEIAKAGGGFASAAVLAGLLALKRRRAAKLERAA